MRGAASREAWASAASAALIAAALLYLGPPGTDFAEHAYQEGVYAAHGMTLWNNFWYSGRYSFVTYSVLYYPLAAIGGIRALAVLCVVAAVLAFRHVTGRRWGPAARWSSRSMAIVLPCFVLTGAFPFLLGATLALLALMAIEARRRVAFAALCALTAAASPLALLLLGVVFAGFRWESRARGGLALGAVAAVVFAVTRLFDNPLVGSVPAAGVRHRVRLLARARRDHLARGGRAAAALRRAVQRRGVRGRVRRRLRRR